MTMNKAVYAEDCAYWQTSQKAPDTWIEDAKRLIHGAGGVVLADGYANETGGRAAYMIRFRIASDTFVAIEIVLQSRSGNALAARRQAATTLYHEIKMRCVAAKRRGARWAFLQYLMLPDGRTAGEASAPAIMEAFPKMLVQQENWNE